MKVFQNRYKFVKEDYLPLISKNENEESSKRKSTSSVEALSSLIYGNLYLVYKDGSHKWVYNYEIKKLLFYFKLLPNSRNIKILRIFPINFKKFNLKSYTFIDKEDEFTELKEDKSSTLNLINKTKGEIIFDNLVEKIKTIFYEKYNLILRSLDIETFELNDVAYLLDIKEVRFEQYSNNFSQLGSERKHLNFRERFQYKSLKIKGEAQNHKEIKNFFFTMHGVYENLQNKVLGKYLEVGERNTTTDEVFKILRSNCPYKYSELISSKKSKKEFQKWASENLWNN